MDRRVGIYVPKQTNNDREIEIDWSKCLVFQKYSRLLQNPRNKVKGAGGAIGLTENDEKFMRWMLCAPEEARMVREFEQKKNLNLLKKNLNLTFTDITSSHKVSKADS